MALKLKNLPPIDLYDLLGVDHDATREEIVSAYRRIARHCHPDTTNGDKKKAEIFRLATLSYDILSNGRKRAEYDRLIRPSVVSRILPWLTPKQDKVVSIRV